MSYLRKYNVLTTGGTNICLPMIKAGVNDFAAGGDWTPAAGDVKVSKDGGAEANITNLPTYTNGTWQFALTATELLAKQVTVKVVDSATKAVEDQFFVVETFGNASAQFVIDYSNPIVSLNLAQAVPPTGAVVESVGDALNAARAAGFGKETIVGTADTLYAADGTTVVKAFTLNSSTAPTSRT